MVFTFSYDGLCIVFRQWRITGPTSLVFSLLVVALLTAGYEGVKKIAQRYEQAQAAQLAKDIDSSTSMSLHKPSFF